METDPWTSKSKNECKDKVGEILRRKTLKMIKKTNKGIALINWKMRSEDRADAWIST